MGGDRSPRIKRWLRKKIPVHLMMDEALNPDLVDRLWGFAGRRRAERAALTTEEQLTRP